MRKGAKPSSFGFPSLYGVSGCVKEFWQTSSTRLERPALGRFFKTNTDSVGCLFVLGRLWIEDVTATITVKASRNHSEVSLLLAAQCMDNRATLSESCGCGSAGSSGSSGLSFSSDN